MQIFSLHWVMKKLDFLKLVKPEVLLWDINHHPVQAEILNLFLCLCFISSIRYSIHQSLCVTLIQWIILFVTGVLEWSANDTLVHNAYKAILKNIFVCNPPTHKFHFG